METVKTRGPRNKPPLVVGTGKDMQFNPKMWEKWNADACRADSWKHGRVSKIYREKYDQIRWH